METHIGPYRVIERIGEGGMGAVDLAVGADGNVVAIKALRPSVIGGTDGRARFEREVSAMARVRGNRVAEVVDADLRADPPYVVTRYVRGMSLAKVVGDHGPLQGDALLRVATGLLEAVATVHAAGIVHRDVKPANVLLTDDGPVLIDFGLAHASDETRLTSAGMVVGTPGYLAPEIALGRDVTFSSDVHSWAATMVFASTGRSPYGTGPDAVILDRIRRGDHNIEGVPASLASLVSRALQVDASERPSVTGIAAALGVTGLPHQPVATPDAAETVVANNTAETVVASNGAEETVVVPGGRAGNTAAGSATAVMADTAPQRPLRQSAAAPLRLWQPRLAVGLGALVLLLLIALWPYVGGIVLVAAMLVGRVVWRIRRRLHDRRAARGARKSDQLVATLAVPVDVLVSLVPSVVHGTLVLAGGYVVGAGVNTVEPLRTSLGGLIPYFVGAAVALTLAWWGPGSQRFRYGVRVIARPLARARRTSWIVAGILVALGWVVALLLDIWGPSWVPGDGPPNPFS